MTPSTARLADKHKLMYRAKAVTGATTINAEAAVAAKPSTAPLERWRNAGAGELRQAARQRARRPKPFRQHHQSDPLLQAVPAPAANEKGADPVVLVVDDDPVLRRLVREIFTLEGRDVQEAPHGGVALEQLRAGSAGMIVLLGLMMPEVDGEAVLEALAADEALSTRHSFVMVTAALPRARDGRVAELLGQLNIPLVPKPFSVTELLSAVESASDRLA